MMFIGWVESSAIEEYGAGDRVQFNNLVLFRGIRNPSWRLSVLYAFMKQVTVYATTGFDIRCQIKLWRADTDSPLIFSNDDNTLPLIVALENVDQCQRQVFEPNSLILSELELLIS